MTKTRTRFFNEADALEFYKCMKPQEVRYSVAEPEQVDNFWYVELIVWSLD